MPDQPGSVAQLVQRFNAYLPTLVAGLLVVALGLVAGWVARRALIRILVWLRLDRLGGRSGWRAALGKGDVRAALYSLVGSIAFALVFLVFLDNALQIWGLTVLSAAIDKVVRYSPNLGLVALVAGIGVALADGAARRVEETLAAEGVARARLAGKVLKGALLSIVAAIALWQLDLARPVVLAAFVTTFAAFGVAFALAIGLGSAKAVQAAWERLMERREDE